MPLPLLSAHDCLPRHNWRSMSRSLYALCTLQKYSGQLRRKLRAEGRGGERMGYLGYMAAALHQDTCSLFLQ